jgi:hypothetical protein
LVNKNMAAADSALAVAADSVQILRFPGMTTGTYRRPRHFGGMGKDVDEDGFSDHFPIAVRVNEAD